MLHFGLILPAGVIGISLGQLMLFMALVVIMPGTFLVTIIQAMGIKRTKRKTTVTYKQLVLKFTGIFLYHLTMLGVWIISWPQFTNNIHTGYGIDGLPYYGLTMVVWTLTGLLLVYGWHVLLNSAVRRPSIGMFIRLYIWNLLFMVACREIIYWYIT